MVRIYNSYSKSALLFLTLSLIVAAIFPLYIFTAIRQGTLLLPINEIIQELSNAIILVVVIVPLFVALATKARGYGVSDEGIGVVVLSKIGWQFQGYTKWEDIVAINYKKIFFCGKFLVIHSSRCTHRNKKVLYVFNGQRNFKEIVSIVCKKTKLHLE